MFGVEHGLARPVDNLELRRGFGECGVEARGIGHSGVYQRDTRLRSERAAEARRQKKNVRVGERFRCVAVCQGRGAFKNLHPREIARADVERVRAAGLDGEPVEQYFAVLRVFGGK